jgi:hypothetical protein
MWTGLFRTRRKQFELQEICLELGFIERSTNYLDGRFSFDVLPTAALLITS